MQIGIELERVSLWLRSISTAMKDQESSPYGVLVRVAYVDVVGKYALRLSFSDGTTREVDLEESLFGPVFEPLHDDPELFAQVKVDHELGTIVWPNGADMDPVVLHGSADPAWKTDGQTSPRRAP